MIEEVRDGRVKIADSSFSATFAMRTDLVKHTTQIGEFPKMSLNYPMSMAFEFAKAAMASSKEWEIDDLARFCIELSDSIFKRGDKKGWLSHYDMDAVQRLENAEPESDYRGIAPGRK